MAPRVVSNLIGRIQTLLHRAKRARDYAIRDKQLLKDAGVFIFPGNHFSGPFVGSLNHFSRDGQHEFIRRLLGANGLHFWGTRGLHHTSDIF